MAEDGKIANLSLQCTGAVVAGGVSVLELYFLHFFYTVYRIKRAVRQNYEYIFLNDASKSISVLFFQTAEFLAKQQKNLATLVPIIFLRC